MNQQPSETKPEVTAAVQVLLDHVARYRLTVFPALQRLPVLAGFNPGQIKDVLKTARHQQWLASAPLHGGAKYWYLTAAGAQRCGVMERNSGPLSEPAKFRAYAMLHFCCLTEQSRHRLLPEELKRYFPELNRPGLPTGYYLNPAERKPLGFLRVDTGHRGRWDRVLQTLREDIRDHLMQPAFARLAQAGRFEMTLATVLPAKAERITECLTALPESRRLPVKTVAIPELLPLIMGKRRRKGGVKG